MILSGVNFSGFLRAEEGMYLPNNLPLEFLKNRHGFVPSRDWTHLMQQAAVRFENGGSGSFVSPDGLVFTNHHVGLVCAEGLSTSGENLAGNGFLARSVAEEKKCPNLEVSVLQSILDVTEHVSKSVESGTDSITAERARRASLNSIEQSESKRTGLVCETVSLWNGAEYHLYCYKRYTDLRLVFIPEVDIGRFGGDPDNFEFPRGTLDIAFFRAYENDKPAKPGAYFPWRTHSLEEGELIFTSGHPGRTSRGHTVATLKTMRDTVIPQFLNMMRRFEIALQQFSYRGPEEARIADGALFGIQNGRKRYVGELRKLHDPIFMAGKERIETDFRARLAQHPELQKQYADAWGEISNAEDSYARIYTPFRLLERGSFWSQLLGIARGIVRFTEERTKPNAERLREYSDARLRTIEAAILSPAPIYSNLEVVMLGESLELFIEILGADAELVKKILAGKNPQERAFELVSRTRLQDISYRKNLLDGSLEVVKRSDDPMIQLAQLVDPEARHFRKVADASEEQKRQNYSKIYQAMREINGTSGTPDATFTLRISVGIVSGYQQQGIDIAPMTDFAWLFKRAADHGNNKPWKLPERWLAKESILNLATPLNFVSTNDITGGNSGSPVVDREGRVVGIIFDSNIQGIGNDYAYSDVQARAVSVSSAGIVEALRKVYSTENLVKELLGNN